MSNNITIKIKAGDKHFNFKEELDKNIKKNGDELSGDITFDKGSTYSIGTNDKKLKALYVDEVHISKNTLYVGGTPVLGTNDDTINIKADEDQSIMVKTIGAGQTQLSSETGININAKGTNSNINLISNGSNSNINISAENISLEGTTTIKDLNVTGTTTTVNSNNMSVKDNLIEINNGETGNGVSAGLAGLKVMRGDSSPYFIEFDEADDLFKVGMSSELEAIASRPWVNAAITNAVNAKYEKEFTIAANGNIVQEGKISKTARLLVLDPYTDSDTYNCWIPADAVAVLAFTKTGYKIFNYTEEQLKFMVVA